MVGSGRAGCEGRGNGLAAGPLDDTAGDVGACDDRNAVSGCRPCDACASARWVARRAVEGKVLTFS
jgi:hypothetical protein